MNLKILYVDITRFVPGGDVLDIKNSFVQVPLPGIPTPLQPSLGLLGDVIIPLFGYDTFKGDRLKGLGQSQTEDWKIKLKKIFTNITPNFPFFPGSYSTERIERAKRNVPSIYRTPETELGAVFKSLGFKYNEADLDVLRANKIEELNKALRPFEESATEIKNQYIAGKINAEQFEKNIIKNSEEVARIVNRYSKKLNLNAQLKNRREYLEGFLALPGEIIDQTTRMLDTFRQ